MPASLSERSNGGRSPRCRVSSATRITRIGGIAAPPSYGARLLVALVACGTATVLGCAPEVKQGPASLADAGGEQGGSGGSTPTSSSTGGGGAPGCSPDLDTDPHNCGSCGHDCLGGACQAGACLPVVLAALPDVGAIDVAVDAANVYWLGTDGSLTSLPKTGGTPALLVGEFEIAATHIVVGGGQVYFNGPGLMAASTQGGSPIALAPGVLVQDVATDGVGAFFAPWETLTIQYVDPSGGPASTLWKGTPPPGSDAAHCSVFVAVDATSLYWATRCEALDGSCLNQDTVQKMPLTGGPAVTLLSGLSSPFVIAVDDAFVYAVVSMDACGPEGIVRAPIDGGPQEAVVDGDVGGVAVDGSRIYWTNAGGGLHTMPKLGGPVMTLDPGPWLWQPVVDETSVFYLGDGGVKRVAKP